MSDPVPAKPAAKPVEPVKKPDEVVDQFVIQIADDLKEKELSEKMDALIKQNAEQMKVIVEMNTKAQLEERDKLIESKLDELESIPKNNPDKGKALRKKFKDEKDIGRLDDAIKLAKEFNTDDFPELKGGGKDDEETATPLNMVNPNVEERKTKPFI